MAAARDPLVIFTPSGQRGRVPAGTTVLAAARSLGVDLDSVCGGRGICSKCQVSPSFGDFPKHGISAAPEALSAWNAVEERYDRIRGLAPGRRSEEEITLFDGTGVGLQDLAVAGAAVRLAVERGVAVSVTI